MFDYDREWAYSSNMKQLKQKYEETSSELKELKESMIVSEIKPGLPTKLAIKYQGNFFLTYLFVGLGIVLTEACMWGLCVAFSWLFAQWILGPLFYIMLVWWSITTFFVGVLVHKHKGFESW